MALKQNAVIKYVKELKDQGVSDADLPSDVMAHFQSTEAETREMFKSIATKRPFDVLVVVQMLLGTLLIFLGLLTRNIQFFVGMAAALLGILRIAQNRKNSQLFSSILSDWKVYSRD